VSSVFFFLSCMDVFSSLFFFLFCVHVFFFSSNLYVPALSQAASVATLPSALFVERLSLGASWVFSIH